MRSSAKPEPSLVPVIAYAELMGMTMVPTVRSAMARLIRNMFET